MRVIMRGLVMLALLVGTGSAGRVEAQAPVPNQTFVISPYGYAAMLPPGFGALNPPDENVDVFASSDRTQFVDVTMLGTPETDPSLVQDTDALVWGVASQHALSGPVSATAVSVTSPLRPISVLGADQAATGAVSYTDSHGVPTNEYVILALRRGVAFQLMVQFPSSLDTASPSVAQAVLSSFFLTTGADAKTVWPPILPPLTTSTASSSANAGSGTNFADGTYIVGGDIPAGTYRAPGGSDCYWARLSGFDGTSDEILANDYGHTSPIVTIHASDAGFQTSDCGTWAQVG